MSAYNSGLEESPTDKTKTIVSQISAYDQVAEEGALKLNL